MDLLGDIGMEDQLTSVRSENAVLQQRVKELSARVKTLTLENETLKAEVELYRKEMPVTSLSKMALGGDDNGNHKDTSMESGDDFVRAGNGVFPKTNDIALVDLHSGNNLTCALSPDDVVLASGGADATLRLLPWGAAEGKDGDACKTVVQKAASVACAAPVITIAFSPVVRNVLAVGCMDGSVALVHYESTAGSATLSTTITTLPKKHVKYVRTVAWSPTDALFASSSADGCIYLYKVEKKTELMITDDDDDSTVKLEATLMESLHLQGAVEAMCFVKQWLVCYVRDTPHLTYFDLTKDMKQTKFNLNHQQDGAGGFSEHVSFCILDLRPSPDSKYLAAATDTSRNIILELSTGKLLRNLYGHSNDGFSQPKLSWSLNGQYILGNTQDDSVICVWDIASQQIVLRLGEEKNKAHTAPIRDMCTGHTMDLLVTTAFDKSTRLWF